MNYEVFKDLVLRFQKLGYDSLEINFYLNKGVEYILALFPDFLKD